MKRIKKYEHKLRHNCPTCQATYTLLETHLTKKDPTICPNNCQKIWEEIIFKHCREKVLSQELEQENKEE